MKVNIRNDAPTAKVRNTDVPILRTRFSSVLTATTSALNFAGAGYLMGMLGLTYSKKQTRPEILAIYKSDDIPVVSIRNTD